MCREQQQLSLHSRFYILIYLPLVEMCVQDTSNHTLPNISLEEHYTVVTKISIWNRTTQSCNMLSVVQKTLPVTSEDVFCFQNNISYDN